MKKRDFDMKVLDGQKGCYGLASKLVDYNDKIENVVSNLLGSTVIVENMENAIELARYSMYSFRIVTIDGDVINPQGSLTGGSKKAESSNLIGREREIETLGTDIEKLKQRSAQIDQEIANMTKNFAEEKIKLNTLLSECNSKEIELAAEKEKLNKYNSALLEIGDNLKALDMEGQTLRNKLKLIDEDLSKSEKIESALSGNKVDADEIIKEKKEKFEKLRVERDDINNKISLVKVEMAQSKTKLGSIEAEVERIDSEISKFNSNLVVINDQIEKNVEFINSCEEMIKQKLASAPTTDKKLELEKEIEKRQNVEKEKLELSNKLKELDENKQSVLGELSSIKDKKFREEMNLSKVDSELEQMQERIYEEYSLSYSTCLELRKPDFNINEAMPRIAKIKKDINALGYVNVNAIEDCKVLLERYDDLNGQANDLEKAQDDLNKIIKDLSSIMIEKFNNELDKINESFKLTFKELFGGGTAKLALSDENDPLESGVEIFAQPPGKKIQNMTLLSGGEKSLTAMAVIFAILRIKPLPFCLFDEVEAALDDSNVEIVDKYLKKLAKDTQFILITHKKPTMEYANALYGVTMEEKGISKIVSVLLSDAIKHAQEA
jgi:chromosome segregation protein